MFKKLIGCLPGCYQPTTSLFVIPSCYLHTYMVGKCFKTLSFLHVVNWIKGVIKNDHDDNYIHASKIFANAIFMPPAGCITKQQLLSFNWGPNCSSSNREQQVQFNKGENSSGSNPIIFFLLCLVHSFILFLLPWSRIQISESIYLLRARGCQYIHNNIDRIFAFYLPFLQVTMSTKAIFASWASFHLHCRRGELRHMLWLQFL